MATMTELKLLWIKTLTRWRVCVTNTSAIERESNLPEGCDCTPSVWVCGWGQEAVVQHQHKNESRALCCQRFIICCVCRSHSCQHFSLTLSKHLQITGKALRKHVWWFHFDCTLSLLQWCVKMYFYQWLKTIWMRIPTRQVLNLWVDEDRLTEVDTLVVINLDKRRLHLKEPWNRTGLVRPWIGMHQLYLDLAG